jgi:hypothetical protein
MGDDFGDGLDAESDLESIAGEVIMAHLPQLLARSLGETFGKTDPTPEPTDSPNPNGRPGKTIGRPASRLSTSSAMATDWLQHRGQSKARLLRRQQHYPGGRRDRGHIPETVAASRSIMTSWSDAGRL